jgi:hypothetical protein
MGERATTPTRREEAAFATTPTTPRTREDAPTGFVEVANGDLGALFGGCEGDDDWLTPTGGGGEVGASASASARVGGVGGGGSRGGDGDGGGDVRDERAVRVARGVAGRWDGVL